MLKNLFGLIKPPDYDKINALLSLMHDNFWRKKAAKKILQKKPEKILDLCCGTGDLAIILAKEAKNKSEITGLDFCPSFLEHAQKKAEIKKVNIKWVNGDASSMPFPDEYFNSIGISFAFRNIIYNNPNSKLHLKEIHRVLKKGGTFVIIETSQPPLPIVKYLFHLYLKYFVSTLGGKISKNEAAYKYLAESARGFLDSKQVKELLISSGFSKIISKSFMLGAIGLYEARK